VWVTETGWPVSGKQQNQAVASPANARIYWEDVSCSLMKNNVNLFYYTLQDVEYTTPSPSFGIKPGGDLKAVNPLFSLTCVSYTIPLLPFLLSSLLSLLLLLYNVFITSWVVRALLLYHRLRNVHRRHHLLYSLLHPTIGLHGLMVCEVFQ